MLLIRSVFLILSLLFSILFTGTWDGGYTTQNVLAGAGFGLFFSIVLFGTETLFKKSHLKTFNTTLLGLVLGYLMAQAILLIFRTVAGSGAMDIAPTTMGIINLSVFLLCTYTAINLTARASDEVYAILPFVRFKPTSQKKKDILLDASVLLDPRLIDLAASGLLDQHLIIPRFTVKELNDSLENYDESVKAKARRGLEVLKKLDCIPLLELRYVDTDFVDVNDTMTKLIRLARMHDANIFTADMNKIEQSSHDGVKIINIHSLSNALKPITQTGEQIIIKIQRYGKEPRQGVGYLEDGTMVVINGGAEFIGETIKAQVLSVKHTSSGRMIFCNAAEEGQLTEQEIERSVADMESTHKNYFEL